MKYSDYYPQQRIVTKFDQKNCDALAIRLWAKAYPEVDHEALVEDMLERRLGKHLRELPHLEEHETSFDPEYTYKRVETVSKIVKQVVMDNLKANEEK